MNALLIVGADSVIGRQLCIECGKAGIAVQASTRRTESLSHSRFFLDLEAESPEKYLPEGLDPVIIVAARTRFDACEIDQTSAQVNVAAPLKLAECALKAGRRVVFLSTSSVFGGDLPFCNEDDVVMPQAAYSRQKVEAERHLRELPGWAAQGAIVRLSKVLAPDTSPIAAWRDALACGRPISPFSDMVFAPVSVQYAAKALIEIAQSAHAGNFHLSGAADLSYVEFARKYTAAHHCEQALVVPITSTQAGIDLLFSRRYGALGMRRTRHLTGIAAQDMEEVIADLLLAEQALH
jgi:dTDP-4-dehydrorhamnose reductase